jgi:hypothetical protein
MSLVFLVAVLQHKQKENAHDIEEVSPNALIPVQDKEYRRNENSHGTNQRI